MGNPQENETMNRAFRSGIFWTWTAFLCGGAAWLRAPSVWAQACAISFDNAGSASANASSVTFPLNVSGSNRLLGVQVGVAANDGASSITGATYAGVSMTQVLQSFRAGGGGDRQATLVLVNPTLGVNDVIVRMAGSKPMNVGAISYNGVDQTSPVGATTFVQNASSTAHSVQLTTTMDNSLVLSNFLWYSASVPLTGFGAGQTQRWIHTVSTDSTEGDDKLTTTAGNYTMS